MFRVICAVISMALILSGIAAGSSTAHARKRHHPAPQAVAQDRYCLQGRRWGYPGNCPFATYSQCMATASGTIDACGLNPTYAFREWQGPR
ncbi:DUF3551 domain-containing protein [Bradyrhizobium sp. CCGUVB23]|uniref:DUF3551 domain-containing protein n=1 Tax=Bradyrhizobium sp. CCGUVB23 TaxID=2949630 RepID=UPI0020B2F09C|nr:DUF3551 domain-containing protein [Bradyrhizobium sp. CCGUVB23]MCP3465900.1 DUF3551 domain-containing protein [Bradyrhizobium sp. CCGUVB23]